MRVRRLTETASARPTAVMRTTAHLTLGPLLVGVLAIGGVTPRAQDAWIVFKSALLGLLSSGFREGSRLREDMGRSSRGADERQLRSGARTSPDVDLLAPGADECGRRGHRTQWCRTSAADGLKTGTIDLLAPSASVWKTFNALSSLGMPKNDENYHAKVLMSEYIPIGHWEAQDTRPAGRMAVLQGSELVRPGSAGVRRDLPHDADEPRRHSEAPARLGRGESERLRVLLCRIADHRRLQRRRGVHGVSRGPVRRAGARGATPRWLEHIR